MDKEVWLSIRTDGQAGEGTLASPFNGSGNGFDTKLREWSILNNVTNITIRLLPGVYETQGTLAWYVRSGWRILGAGIDKTIINWSTSPIMFGALSLRRSSSIPASKSADLTVDCNYSPTNPNKAAAVGLAGRDHTIRRVKAINAYGQLPVSETFVLHIGIGEGQSDGNLIEECEVSSFKGAYCSSIGLIVGSTGASIGGIVRNNKVYDLHAASGPSLCTAYGFAGLKGALIENNFSYRCDIAVNIDTYKSQNAVLRGNQFYACRNRGLSLVGDSLENYVIEDNLIEIDPIRADWALLCSDGDGRDVVRNFKIRNNIIRPLNNLVGNGGGMGIFVTQPASFSISGNRVEAGLRNAFLGSAPGFDNTDFFGNTISSFDGLAGNQVNLPRGEPGTLLLNKGSAYVIAELSASPVINGKNLVAAYAKARAMRPHGEALSPQNRATLFLFPGRYLLESDALVLNTPFVDVIGLGSPGAVRLESPGNTLVQLADNVVLENLTLHCSSPAPPTLSSQDKAAYFPESNLPATTMKNCTFSAENNGWGMRLGIAYAGQYIDCRAPQRGWSGSFTGTALNCSAGDFSFGSGGFSGAATNCHAGANSFGAGAFHGTAKNCVAGHGSFGGQDGLLAVKSMGPSMQLLPAPAS